MMRTTLTPDNQLVYFKVPLDYVGKEIEVIVFSKNEGIATKMPLKKKVSFSAVSLDTRGFKFNREEANEQ